MDRHELRDRQEASARHHVRWRKSFYASLVTGAIFLILPRAVPWFSSGMPETAMGRGIISITNLQPAPLAMVAGVHMVLAVCYGFILAMCIYRFASKPAVFLGALIGFVLYGLNFFFFRTFLGTSPVNEAPVIFTHLFYALIFSAAYRGISVPDANRVSDRGQSA